jgi:tetratricopeptide (TPR) repeat protein
VCPALEGYALSAGLLVLGFPLAALMLVLWHEWVMRGHWPIAVPAIGIAVLLINLLAAGGIGFASVASTLWILAALLINHVETENAERLLSQRRALTVALAGLIAVGLFTHFGYLPQLNRETSLAEGETQRLAGQRAAALEAFRQATEEDPYSPDGWERVADTAHQVWSETGSDQYYREFVAASQRMIALNDRSSFAHSQVARWWLSAYRRFGQSKHLEEAVRYCRIAIELYPNYNLGHAELAWVLHVAGNDSEAARESAEALRLDQLTPHAEQKLAEQRVYDAPQALPNQRPLPGDRTAEQLMQQLRNNKVSNS